ncbi:MAG: hypothetical protein D5R98_08050 [Desulfonatronovibrio sp. MSAO_Bac4]|nr:MAG: hypothetical protein D5R98_08050 [Desulfonatronovibrio sp. MSAO_Bac4]
MTLSHRLFKAVISVNKKYPSSNTKSMKLPADTGLVAESMDDLKKAVKYLAIISFNHISGFLHSALQALEI